MTVRKIAQKGQFSSAQRAPAPGDTRADQRGIEQVWVPAGAFTMGTADTSALDPPRWAKREIESEQPQREVHITRGYQIDKYKEK